MSDAPEPKRDRDAEIGLCILLAAADGDISDREIGALSTRLGKLLGDEVVALALDAVCEREISNMDRLGPEGYIAGLATRIPEARRLPALEAALRIAAADGLAAEEEQMFRDVASVFGIPSLVAEGVLAAKKSTPSPAR